MTGKSGRSRPFLLSLPSTFSRRWQKSAGMSTRHAHTTVRSRKNAARRLLSELDRLIEAAGRVKNARLALARVAESAAPAARTKLSAKARKTRGKEVST
jgi:hypothetical protein